MTLKYGQALYIPKNWWHWIKTSEKTLAVNYWFVGEPVEKPFKFSYESTIHSDMINSETVHVWNSKKDKDEKITTFGEFYNSGEDDMYVITLGNYTLGSSNLNLKKKLGEHVRFPEEACRIPDVFDYNVWASSSKHDTGLHYDDEDGILHVLEGTKEVILFPPSDTPYLYPFDTKYPWLHDRALDFRYNTGTKIKSISGVSSSRLLYETCKHNKKVCANISKLFKNFPIWGFKKQGDEYRWEMYSYTLDRNPCIISRDIFSDQYEIGLKEHFYYSLNEKVQLPFWGYGKFREHNTLFKETKLFVLDSRDSFEKNYSEYMHTLGYYSILHLFRDIIFKYPCYEICIHNKGEKTIFVQYLGISKEDFVDFLVQNEYPTNIVQFVQTENYNINNEITVVYDVSTKNIIRSGFYGVV
jgi:hypothetical protein